VYRVRGVSGSGVRNSWRTGMGQAVQLCSLPGRALPDVNNLVRDAHGGDQSERPG
jgi:hypothetical protein